MVLRGRLRPPDSAGGRPREYARPRAWAMLGLLAATGLGCKPEQAVPDRPVPADIPASSLTVYKFARVVTAPHQVVEGGAVVVEGKRFHSVLAAGEPLPAGARVVDHGRYTAIPGLIDAHTHITFCWDPAWGERAPNDPFQISQPKDRLVPLVEANGRTLLSLGVTTIRDLGSDNHLDLETAARIEAGELVGPRIFGAADGVWSSRLTPTESTRPGQADGTEQVAATVRREIAAGVKVVKLWASTGSDDDLTGERTYSFDEIKTAVDIAHAHGIPVAVHDTLGTVTPDIVRAGADSVEHPRTLSPETLAAMRERGVAYVPTIHHNRYYRDNIERFGFSPDKRAAFDAFIADNVATARAAHAAGVTIVMGSDAVYTAFSESTRELDVFVHDVGMTPMEALATATTDAAKLLRADDRIGAIRPEFLADFVVIDGDLSQIEHIHNVVAVVKEGAVVFEKPSAGPN
ncbi:amidohydrolase family protein [Nannocystis bainbridge]|uniref:Amidohydrolase family protein n=1 Tax=Nannocystis bainbridge TaxID=2995303 RepID=A0ABT5E2G3_9BACT|nr:amidohydrolase family protein [Nannocystis bainbridge]MDC0719148.1 amidohydrolase family protein [Nannocystis bainbridge]